MPTLTDLKRQFYTTQLNINGDKMTISDLELLFFTNPPAGGVLNDNSVTSAKIADGTIVDADISNSAAINPSKVSGTALVRDRTISAAPASSGWHGQIRITYATSGASPTAFEIWYDGGGTANLASFWLNENGAPRAANPKPADSALKLAGWGPSQTVPTFMVQQRTTDGGTARTDQWGIDKNGMPVLGANNIPGAHIIKLGAAEAIPSGLPAGTFIGRV